MMITNLLDWMGDGFERGGNITVGVDIGKSVNSTVISAWSLDKSDTENIARLVYLEEINARTGGHDIPYQRQRIMDVTNQLALAGLLWIVLELVVRSNKTSD